MTDTLTHAQRSERMAKIRDRDTKPEMIVRRFLHASGLRFRLHRRIAGVRPDIVFPSRRIALFVHGCMWNQPSDPACKLACMPKSRLDFWKPKLECNREHDGRQRQILVDAGWIVLTVWECEIPEKVRLMALSLTIQSVDGHIRPEQV